MIEFYSVCGAWNLSNTSQWEFIVDYDRGSSLSVITENITFNELVKIVLEDFGIDGNAYGVKISYGSPSCFLSATIDLPPVILRNDRQLKVFMNKLQESGGVIKLCVTMKELKKMESAIEVSSPHYGPFLAVDERETNSFSLMERNNIQISNDVPFDESFTAPAPTSHPPRSFGNEFEESCNVPFLPRATRRMKSSTISGISQLSSSLESGRAAPSCSSQSVALDKDGVYCGKLFKDKKEMVTMLRMFSMFNSFEFRTELSDRIRYVLRCVDECCSWRFRATRVRSSESFIVRQYVHDHTCDSSLRHVNHWQASAKVLGTMVSNHYDGGKLGLRPKQIIEKARKDHGVVITYSKAWRAQEHAKSIARGTPDDSYEVLPSFFHMVKEKNPGSATFIEVDAAGKFKYAFLSFGASIRGFKALRKVVAIDGAFLKAKFRGTLLGATVQHGNFQLYPIAFGIVDSENDASWNWFLRCLRTIIPDEKDLVFVSDRAPCIPKGLLTNYPLAHHGICSFHFEKNVETYFKDPSLVALVQEAIKAYTKYDFNLLFNEIKSADAKLADYLVKADIRKWSRAYAPSNRYNIMTSNIAESLNSLLNMPREYPIVCLFDTIRSILTRWFNERHEISSRHPHPVTLEVGKKMKEYYDGSSRWLEVCPINQFVFKVKGDKRKEEVNLAARQCTCCVFDIQRFPCAHAIAAAKAVKHNENNYVDSSFSKERWILAYSESIYPVGDKAYWDIPPNVASFVCLPPSTRIPSGRRKKKRIPSGWEHGKSRTKSKSYKCRRCGQSGHNKSTCVVPI